ncbi:MAG: ABC transporter permease, partial [Sphingobacteriales bacterium]
MVKNYFKVAWRNLFKNRAFTFINIAGLCIGMACTILILLWVYNERSWDKYNDNYEEIYHVMANRNFNGAITTGPDMMYPLPKAAKINLPEVEYAAVVSFGETTLFTAGDKKLNRRTLTTTSDFFKIFSFNFLQGSSLAIDDPDAVVLTESTAKALYGNSNIIGQPVKINNNRTAYIKAVIKDVPGNSTLQFDGLIPFNPSSEAVKASENEWVNCDNRIFFKTRGEVNIANLETKVLSLIKENTGKDNPTTRGSVILHPMKKWRLFEEFKDGKNTGGRIQYVQLFICIAIIILIIACVNFMNLSTARSEKRAREVGIRKTLGSGRKQLVGQFMAESMLLTIIAFLLAVTIVYTLIPAFSAMLNEDIVVPYKEIKLWVVAAGIIIITGFVAGSYPAFYLSGFNPVKVLKGTFLSGKQALLPRKILVTSQFVISIILISATLIIYQQLQYVKKRDIGYSPNNLIMVNSSTDTDKNFEAMRNDLQQTGMIASVTRTSTPITNLFGFTSGIRWAGAPESSSLVIGFLFAGEDFAKTLNAKILDGRDFRTGDTNAVLFNKEAIKLMGIKSPIGSEITWAGRKKTIIGVIDNMIMTSPYEAPSPFMINYENKWSGNINIRLNNNADVGKSLTEIEGIHKKYSAEYPFEYRFVDEDFNRKF